MSYEDEFNDDIDIDKAMKKLKDKEEKEDKKWEDYLMKKINLNYLIL